MNIVPAKLPNTLSPESAVAPGAGASVLPGSSFEVVLGQSAVPATETALLNRGVPEQADDVNLPQSSGTVGLSPQPKRRRSGTKQAAAPTPLLSLTEGQIGANSKGQRKTSAPPQVDTGAPLMAAQAVTSQLTQNIVIPVQSGGASGVTGPGVQQVIENSTPVTASNGGMPSATPPSALIGSVGFKPGSTPSVHSNPVAQNNALQLGGANGEAGSKIPNPAASRTTVQTSAADALTAQQSVTAISRPGNGELLNLSPDSASVFEAVSSQASHAGVPAAKSVGVQGAPIKHQAGSLEPNVTLLTSGQQKLPSTVEVPAPVVTQAANLKATPLGPAAPNADSLTAPTIGQSQKQTAQLVNAPPTAISKSLSSVLAAAVADVRPVETRPAPAAAATVVNGAAATLESSPPDANGATTTMPSQGNQTRLSHAVGVPGLSSAQGTTTNQPVSREALALPNVNAVGIGQTPTSEQSGALSRVKGNSGRRLNAQGGQVHETNLSKSRPIIPSLNAVHNPPTRIGAAPSATTPVELNLLQNEPTAALASSASREFVRGPVGALSSKLIFSGTPEGPRVASSISAAAVPLEVPSAGLEGHMPAQSKVDAPVGPARTEVRKSDGSSEIKTAAKASQLLPAQPVRAEVRSVPSVSSPLNQGPLSLPGQPAAASTIKSQPVAPGLSLPNSSSSGAGEHLQATGERASTATVMRSEGNAVVGEAGELRSPKTMRSVGSDRSVVGRETISDRPAATEIGGVKGGTGSVIRADVKTPMGASLPASVEPVPATSPSTAVQPSQNASAISWLGVKEPVNGAAQATEIPPAAPAPQPNASGSALDRPAPSSGAPTSAETSARPNGGGKGEGGVGDHRGDTEQSPQNSKQSAGNPGLRMAARGPASFNEPVTASAAERASSPRPEANDAARSIAIANQGKNGEQPAPEQPAANPRPISSGTRDAQQSSGMAYSVQYKSASETLGQNLPAQGRNDSAPSVLENILPVAESEASLADLNKFDARQVIAPQSVSSNVRSAGSGEWVEVSRRGADTELAENLWSAVEAFRAAGENDWVVRIKPDTDTHLNLRLRMQDNQLVIDATLERGNWEAVAPDWNELRASLADRGIQLRPLEQGAAQGSSNLNSNSSGGFGQSHREAQAERNELRNLERFLNPRGSEPKKQATPARNPNQTLETWA